MIPGWAEATLDQRSSQRFTEARKIDRLSTATAAFRHPLMRRVTIRSAPRETADILREEILGKDSDGDEWLLGSEDDMIRMLGVSRPTLRQAARMLEQEQLLVVRRGIGGGLFGRRPTAEAVSHTASVFLRSQGATYKDLISTQLILGTECARRAATNPDREAREALVTFYESRLPAKERAKVGTLEFIRATVDFQRRVADLADSPSLRLFVYVLMDLSEGSAPVAREYSDRDRQRQTLNRHEAVAEAIAKGDAKLAAERMRHHLEVILNWVDAPTRNERLSPLRSR
jgi:GntR family transcriptional repressor for pyruvate dehydrogenase complex